MVTISHAQFVHAVPAPGPGTPGTLQLLVTPPHDSENRIGGQAAAAGGTVSIEALGESLRTQTPSVADPRIVQDTEIVVTPDEIVFMSTSSQSYPIGPLQTLHRFTTRITLHRLP